MRDINEYRFASCLSMHLPQRHSANPFAWPVVIAIHHFSNTSAKKLYFYTRKRKLRFIKARLSECFGT